MSQRSYRAPCFAVLLTFVWAGCPSGGSSGGDLEADTTNAPRGDTGDAPGNGRDAQDGRDTQDGRDAEDDRDVEDDRDAAGGPQGNNGEPRGGRYFPANAWFHEDVSGTDPAPYSAEMISALRAAGGWGNRDTLQIDFSLEVLTADPNTPKRAFEPTGDFFDPDCDQLAVPVPVGGNLEGEEGYVCDTDGDCHLIVWAPQEARLYEMWRANLVGDSFFGGCLAVWDTGRAPGERGRGEQCTSADAAGFPIAPLLFDADEVAAGEIAHAIRFILPNDRVRRQYVRPATHGTNTSGGPTAPPYGVHLRLRADYPMDTLPNDGARVVARALQTYGMYHADGGNIALTARSDRRTRAKWDGLLGPRDLSALRVEDFDVIHHSDPIDVTFDCVREPPLPGE